MVQSFTGKIKTNNEFVSVETATGISFTGGNTYLIQILPNDDKVYLKVADAIIEIDNNNPFNYIASTETLYIKTNYKECTLTILESA